MHAKNYKMVIELDGVMFSYCFNKSSVLGCSLSLFLTCRIRKIYYTSTNESTKVQSPQHMWLGKYWCHDKLHVMILKCNCKFPNDAY